MNHLKNFFELNGHDIELDARNAELGDEDEQFLKWMQHRLA